MLVGSSKNKYIFKQKSAASRNRVSEIPIDDGIIQINKHNRQSLGNQIDGFLQNKKVLNNLTRSLRKRKKHVKNSNKVMNHWNNYTGNNDITEEDILSNVARFPIWRVSESTRAVINLDSTTNPSIMETRKIINRPLLAFEKPPSQLENLDHSVDKAIFPIARRIANPKSEVTDIQSPAFKGLNNKISNKRYLLVPISKNLYVLKNVRESSRTDVDRTIIPKRYKLLEKDKDTTSAIFSFKTYMHHDVKDVRKAYLQRDNLHLLDHDMNYLYSTLEPRVPKENENLVSLSHSDFLYPDIAFQTDPNLIDVTSKISEEQVVFPVLDYENISLVDINLHDGINFYDSSTLSISSSFDISDYDVTSKKITNYDQLSTLFAAKLNEINTIRQNSGNYGNSLKYSEFGVELTTIDFRDTFDTLDEYIYTLATLEDVEIDLINDKEVFDTPQNREDPKFLIESNEDKSITDFIDDISTQDRAVFDASNEDNTFFPNITNYFVNNGILNSQDIDNQEYGISISSEYNNKMSTHSNDFYYNNRSIEILFTNYTTEIDSFLKDDYVTSAPLLLSTDEWLLKKAQSNVENTNALLMAIKPLSSELQKLLGAIQLVNQSMSNVQSRLCDKKNVVGSARIERESKNRNATNITKLVDKVDYYNSDFSTKSFNNQSLDKRRIEIEGKNVAERDVKIRRSTIFLNKLMTPFHKYKSSISDLEVQSGRRNFFKKRKLNKREFSKSGDRLSHSRFNRNLKSLTKNYETRMKPIRQFIGLKKMKRTTTPILGLSRLIKSDISSKNFAGGRQNHPENDQINRSIASDNTPSLNMLAKNNSAHFLSDDKRDLTQRNVKRAMSNEISGSGKEKKFHLTDPQFYKEETAYIDIFESLNKTKKVDTTIWTTQKLMESLPLIITTTEFFVPRLTFLPYFIETPTITASKIVSLTQSPVTLSASIIPISTTLPLLYMTELTILSMKEAAISITDLTITPIVAITTEVTEIPITIPMIESFTIESIMLLTPFLEATKTLIEEISAVTEEEIVEIPLFGTQTELMIETTTSIVSVLTSLAITTASQIATSESTVGENITLHKVESTAITSSPMVLEQTETILSTSTISFIKTTITEILPINKTMTTAETPITIKTSTASKILTISTIPTTISTTITTETLTSTEILTTYKTPIIKETTSAKIITPTETLMPIETSTITEITTSTKITEFLMTNKSVITMGTPTSIQILITSEIPTIKSERYYETTREEIATERTIRITTKEVIIIEETTPITFFTFSVETTSEATSPVIETITLPTITKETLLIEKITVTPEIMIEEMSSLSEVTLISTETSTMPTIETSITSTSLVLTTTATTALLLEETAIEITETSLITTIITTATLLPTTKRPEYVTILEAAITVTLAPFSEFILSIIITSETPMTTSEVISTLPKTVSEEFTMSATESPSITYATPISILLIKTTISPIVSISTVSTEELLEAETEYYIAKEPFYEEEYKEYEEYDTEIPTERWYYYDEYKTTKETAVTEKYTKLLKEKTTSSPFIEGTTISLYKIITSEFTKYLTHSEAASTYINVISIVTTSEISYTEKITSTSTLETSTSTIAENVTTVKMETELTASTTSKEVEPIIWLTFGSTEEYTLPSSTTFKISTEPLEYLTVPPKYTAIEWFTEIWLTSPKFTTKPKEIPKIALKKTTIPEEVSETETAVEKLTSFFISSTLTTLPEREVIEVYITTMSTASSEMEDIIKTAYEVITSAILEEETIPSVIPFTTSEAETELVFTTMSKSERELLNELLQRFEKLKQYEKEMAEREERFKEKEKQWEIEKEKCKKMMQRTSVTYAPEETIIPYTIEKSTFITYITKETEETQIIDYITLIPYVTTTIMDLYNIGLTSIESTTLYATKEMYTISYVFETTLFSITEKTISVTYTTEKTEKAIEEITFTPYVMEEIEEAPYTTERSTSITYLTEEIEEIQITDYITFLYITTASVDLYSIGLATIETTTPYTVREIYTTSYITLYSEPLFVSPTITSPTTITLVTSKFITLPIITFSKRFEEISVTSVTTPTWYTTEETYIATYTDIYGKPLFTSPELEFIITLSTIAISTTTETMFTSLSTPVPPTERTTVKAQLTTQIKKITEKKENRMTTKMGITQHTEMKDIEEKEITYIPEKPVTQEEEEIMTKRVCLNVLENTTIPFDKKRRDIVTKKICLPYVLEKKEEEKKSVGRLSRRLLALPNTKKIKRPRWNVPFNFRHRRREKETIRKIDNLQLLDYDWLSNDITKPLQYFKGFTRLYRKKKKFPKKIAMQKNTTDDFQNSTSLCEQRFTNVFHYHESVFQPTATFMLNSKKYEKKNAFFRHGLITTRKSDCYIDNKASIRKRDVSSIEYNERSKKNTVNISNEKAITAADEIYTINVLHLNYDEDKQTHKVISAKPDEDELTAILFESNDDIYVTKFRKNKKITTPNYKIEEEKNEDNEISDKMEKKIEEYNDYIEDLVEDYMNYKEHETSTQIYNGRLLDNGNKDKKMTKNEKELLNQMWPTEKNTMYHLGGARLWELDFVTESTVVLSTTTDKSKTINRSIIRTTCFDAVLKRNDKIKSNISYYKHHFNSNKITKLVSIEKRDVSLENVTRMNALRYELRTKQPRVTKKLKRESQKYKPNHYKQQSFEKKRIVRLNDFRCTSEDSTVKNRKLCIANTNKLKRQIVRHEDTNKHKKKQLAKSQTSQNLHSLHNTDNGIVNKKNAYRKTTANQYLQVGSTDKKNSEKVMHSNIINHKNKSISASHKQKIHNCFNCICDIANVINNIRSVLDRTSFSLNEIKALNCSEYKEIQDKIVISMDSDMEEAKEFPQSHYNIESLKGQKYIKLEELEDNLKSNSELDSDNDVVSLPGLNLNLPCNQDSNSITWLSSISRPSYTWKRTDGFVMENGDLELRNVNAKDTGNYTCVMTYMSPDNEESVETTYEIHLQVVTLPRYIVHGENRYHVRSCDEGDLDVLITVNILLVPSHIVKLMTIDLKRCNVFCLKAIQDKLSLILSKNLQIFLGKTIIFRLPHYEQRLVPIVEKSSFARRKRGKTDANVSAGKSSNIGLFSSCPAGYGLRDTHCVPCNVGTYSEDGISHCKRCPPGTYQPNHGARVCRTCTNPTTKGCYNMLWNSFSAVMVTLASIGAILSICLLLLWIICCAKKKFYVKRIAGLIIRENTFEKEKHVEEQPLIKNASENEDQQWDSEYRSKKKKGKFYLYEDEWGSHRIKNVPIISPDSYRSHEDYNNRKHLLIYKTSDTIIQSDHIVKDRACQNVILIHDISVRKLTANNEENYVI
ncbi:hypothetical protein ALC53_04177 [Atta colombica]|uniref:Ig-like domain-containing protein n=1 Tax=Atta colombica TaxID=520822 RepID=A0A195BKZ0_9HYME|nr:hypothetical protein ALC53_04177 [Atta colombica]